MVSKTTKSPTRKTTKKPTSKSTQKKTTGKKAVSKTSKSSTQKKVATTKKTLTTKKPATGKTRRKITAKPAAKFIVSNEQRHMMICEAAYFRSINPDYQTASPVENWYEAEKSIDLICEVR